MRANCVVCAKEFEKWGRAITCGKGCSREQARRRKRESYARNPEIKRERTRRWRRGNPEKYEAAKLRERKGPRDCIVCGKAIAGRGGAAKTCCDKNCMMALDRARLNRYRRKNMVAACDKAKRWQANNPEKVSEWRQRQEAFRRAAARLSLPPFLYTGLLILDRFRQTQRSPDGIDPRPSV